MTVAPTANQDVQQRLERLYRAMESHHLLYPSHTPDLHDPWRVDLLRDAPGWWNRFRVYTFGPLRITVEMDGSATYKMPGERVLEIARWILESQPLPNLAICGSQSPLSPRLPHGGSDLDFVCFVTLDDLLADPDRWCQLEARLKSHVVPRCIETFGMEVDVGFLLQEFRSYPFLLDVADVDTPDALAQWDLDVGQVVAILERRLAEFTTQAGQAGSDCDRIVTALREAIGARPVVQVAAEARWRDVTWSMRTLQWRDLIERRGLA